MVIVSFIKCPLLFWHFPQTLKNFTKLALNKLFDQLISGPAMFGSYLESLVHDSFLSRRNAGECGHRRGGKFTRIMLFTFLWILGSCCLLSFFEALTQQFPRTLSHTLDWAQARPSSIILGHYVISNPRLFLRECNFARLRYLYLIKALTLKSYMLTCWFLSARDANDFFFFLEKITPRMWTYYSSE